MDVKFIIDGKQEPQNFWVKHPLHWVLLQFSEELYGQKLLYGNENEWYVEIKNNK